MTTIQTYQKKKKNKQKNIAGKRQMRSPLSKRICLKKQNDTPWEGLKHNIC